MRLTAARSNRNASTTAAITSAARLQPSANSTNRRTSDGRMSPPRSIRAVSRGVGLLLLLRAGEPVAEAADGLDAVGADLLAHPADEHLDGVGIAVEVL